MPTNNKGTHQSRTLHKNSPEVTTAETNRNGNGNESEEHTDEETEDCTLTTTDEDDVVETAAAKSRAQRLAIARAHSCPNSDRVSNGNRSNHTEPSMRNSRSSGFRKKEEEDERSGGRRDYEDDVFKSPTRGRNYSSHVPRERKQSRYSRAEISGATYSVS